MLCIQCKADIPVDALFCNKCGTQQSISSSQEPIVQISTPPMPRPDSLTTSNVSPSVSQGSRKRLRVVLGIIGIVLLLLIIWAAYTFTNGLTIQRAALYSGTWLNNNPNTRDIPKLEISNAGQTLTVHVYGACEPTYCDWGTRSAQYTSDPFTITFIFGNGAPTENLTLSLVDAAGTRLDVTDNYTTESFHKEGP